MFYPFISHITHINLVRSSLTGKREENQEVVGHALLKCFAIRDG
jgi:hypothetical protein